MQNIFSELAVFDYPPVIWVNQFMSRWPHFDQFVDWLGSAIVIQYVPMLLVACWLWFEKTPRQAFNRQILLESLLTSFVALILARSLALALPFRDRPFANPDLHFVSPFTEELRTWSSFPSDHAVLAFALAASLFRISPRIGIWACCHAVVIICLPRLYFGLHYPSDLIGGGLIGIALVFATSQLQARHAVTGFLLNVESKYSGMFYAVCFFLLVEIAEMFNSIRFFAAIVFRTLRQVLS